MEEWNTFTKTGSIKDYLRFKDKKEREVEQESGKEEFHGTTSKADWDCTVSDAHRGLR